MTYLTEKTAKAWAKLLKKKGMDPEECADAIMAKGGYDAEDVGNAVTKAYNLKGKRVNEKDLSAKERKNLPDSAFAYIDDEGKRHYPVHDKEHVRAAIAYAKKYKDETARKAWPKIKKAAKKYDIDAGELKEDAQPAHARIQLLGEGIDWAAVKTNAVKAAKTIFGKADMEKIAKMVSAAKKKSPKDTEDASQIVIDMMRG